MERPRDLEYIGWRAERGLYLSFVFGSLPSWIHYLVLLF